MILPDTCDDYLCSCLTPLELVRYSRTCRDAYRAVKSHFQRAYNLKRTLSRFMSADEVDRFQLLQSETGTVISGSVALQFMGRYEFTSSDLDIYTEHRYARRVGDFLTSLGYQYKPRHTQSPSFTVEVARDELIPGVLAGFAGAGIYGSNAMCGAYNFVKPNYPDDMIQLITARLGVMDLILDFHCTAVMNIITHRNAYALFPYETYHAKRALVARKTPARREETALAKYQTRGWKIRRSVYDAEADDPKREFGQATRRVGDKMTWVVPLNQRGEQSALAIDTVVGNSWTLMYHERSSDVYGRPTQGYAKMMRHTVPTGQERWRQIYTFATSAHHTVFMAYLRHIQPAEAKQNDADVVRAVEMSYVRLVRSDSEVMEDYGTIAQVQADYEERLFRSYAGEEVADETDSGDSSN
ncbi:hypothetical protein K525DRAFT_258722 [Schizophyllum commune Loenen D]|nr:hypothetical protein K525DRAFT_258722 [Schizophyllum commune Loenen D]